MNLEVLALHMGWYKEIRLGVQVEKMEKAFAYILSTAISRVVINLVSVSHNWKWESNLHP